MTSHPRPDQGVFGISTVAELTGLHPQTLRGYEARGMVVPARTEGGTRRYSSNDLDRIRRISTMVEAGLNLAGIERVLALEDEIAGLRGRVGDAGRDGQRARGGKDQRNSSSVRRARSR